VVFNAALADRIKVLFEGSPGFEEKKMFGGIGYLLFGNMACGVNRDDLIVRVGPEYYEEALSKPNVVVFDMTGRPMTGWVAVKPRAYQSEESLKFWVGKGTAFALTLPPK
jgi:hypothetical protein